MNRHTDEALNISNPRLLSAVFFALLAVIATIVIDTVLYLIGIDQYIPVFKALFLGVIVAGCFGALFGYRIIHTKRPYRWKVFLCGFVMVLAALPFYDLGFLYILSGYKTDLFANLAFSQIIIMYLFVLLYSFIIAGFWLAIAAGFAAIYLRGRLVYDILHTDTEEETPGPPKKQRPKKHKITKSDNIHIHH
ncbi:hypothetical protein [Legionella spiritensis]|uniref:Uncharacterized protein n=1 Tax=Legionella spiritensis TaxID=452 RepID=A0A0W0ZAI3_LEGSP|nr:hypothetical protein [Legionella spiritensis]KTD66149.1 hypothetical protein Lspi_0212 [Legionella spiritensis]SNV43923.1 Uncharacterised protein [Legionella spiritensis]